VNGSNCMSLWDETYEGIPPWLPPPRPNGDVEIGSAGYAVRNSVMERFTRERRAFAPYRASRTNAHGCIRTLVLILARARSHDARRAQSEAMPH